MFSRYRSSMATTLELQDPRDDAQAVDQPVDVVDRVVDRKRRPGGRGRPEPARRSLPTVVPGAHADARTPEDLPDVVGMGSLQRERNQRPAPGGLRRSVDGQPGNFGQA